MAILFAASSMGDWPPAQGQIAFALWYREFLPVTDSSRPSSPRICSTQLCMPHSTQALRTSFLSVEALGCSGTISLFPNVPTPESGPTVLVEFKVPYRPGTGLTPATSAPGLAPCHICTGTRLTPGHICTGIGPAFLQVVMYCVSGLKIDALQCSNERYKPYKVTRRTLFNSTASLNCFGF